MRKDIPKIWMQMKQNYLGVKYRNEKNITEKPKE